MAKKYDIIIIGAGVVGSAIAYELSCCALSSSGNRISVLLLDKGNDVSTGASKANSGIVHGAYAAGFGTQKGTLGSLGNKLYPELCKKLAIPYKNPGALILAFSDDELATLEKLRVNGRNNGFEPQLLTKKQTISKEPHCSDRVTGSLYSSDVGITSPYEACIALAETAGINRVTITVHRTVTAITINADKTFTITAKITGDTAVEQFCSSMVINAAGAGAEGIARLIEPPPVTLQYRKGQYIIFRRGSGSRLQHVIFQTPGAKGKGILVTPTVWGNLMIGPDAQDISTPDDTTTTADRLYDIVQTAQKSIPDLPLNAMIRDFAGVRSIASSHDFYIAESDSFAGFINVLGIDSPGLTSAPAIAKKVLSMVQNRLGSFSFSPSASRQAPSLPYTLQPIASIMKDSDLPPGAPDRLICRCEQVSEKTLLEAYSAAAEAGIALTATDSIKRRTRAGMGACQGQFCRPRVTEFLQRKNGDKRVQIEIGSGPGSALAEVKTLLLTDYK